MNKPSRYPELEAAVLAVETDQSLNLKVPTKLSKPHPMVIEMNLKEDDPSRFKINRDKIINRGETFDFAVGNKSLERAKLILDTFIKVVEKRGLKIINSGGNTFLLISEEKIQIRLWEKSRFLEKDENTYGYRDQELSGELYFQYVEMGRYVNKQWGDTSYSKLEEKLGRVIGSLEYNGKKEHAERLKREEHWRELKKKEAIIEERNAIKQTEFNNFKLLLNQSLRWEKAQAIRAYISQVEANSNAVIEGFQNIQECAKWAKAKADWYDPTVKAIDESFSPFGDFHEAVLEERIKIDRYNINKL